MIFGIFSTSISLLLLLLTPTITANIKFHWVQPGCDFASGAERGCLRGQTCLTNGTCLSPLMSNRLKFGRASFDDGPCGSALLCHPNNTIHKSSCCVRNDHGDTEEHCDRGCVFNRTHDNVRRDNTTSRPAIGEPTVGQALTSIATGSAATAGPTTVDGTCGAAYGGSMCGNWSRGSCCSMYGWCGNTTSHCGAGCQSGCGNSIIAAGPRPSSAPANANPGSLEVVGSSGVPAMHAALMPNGKVIILDKVEDYTQLNLSNGQYAYSAEYNPSTNEVVPLAYKTNAFCSGGIFLADGRLVNVGGNFGLPSVDPTISNGIKAIRYLERSVNNDSLDGDDWIEPGNQLDTARWYASAQILPDGTIFVASGSLNGYDPAVPANNNPTYEILDMNGITQGQSIALDILVKNQPYYMYPFMHLLKDGSLFVFVAKSSELFSVASSFTIKTFPDLPGDFRTYPNTGGSVILPFSSANNYEPDIIICGGGPYQSLSAPTDASCGRISPFQDDASWETDSMPEGRVMVEGTLLPDGNVIWLNGASQGAQGFDLAADPAYEVLIYDPSQPLGQRFTTGPTSSIARLYHSVALLLLDGTIMISGSNPVEQPVLKASAQDPYVTELRVEIYTPPYLSGNNANGRPMNIILSSISLSADGSTFGVQFDAPSNAQNLSIVLYYGGFVTHSLHMGHRMIILDESGWNAGSTSQALTVWMPPNSNIAPPGPYVVYVLCDGVPGMGQFVSVS